MPVIFPQPCENLIVLYIYIYLHSICCLWEVYYQLFLYRYSVLSGFSWFWYSEVSLKCDSVCYIYNYLAWDSACFFSLSIKHLKIQKNSLLFSQILTSIISGPGVSKQCPVSEFSNKVLLNTSMSICLCNCLWLLLHYLCFCTTTSELSPCERLYVPQKRIDLLFVSL